MLKFFGGFASALIFSLHSASAMTSSADLVQQELEQATLIVEGQVLSQTRLPHSDYYIQTQSTFRISNILKNAESLTPGAEIQISSPGGEREGLGVYYTGLPRPYVNARYRAYLVKKPSESNWSIVGQEQGLVRLDAVRSYSRNRTDGSNGNGDGAFLHWSAEQFPIPFYTSRQSLVGHQDFADAIHESFRPWRDLEGVRVEFISLGCTQNVRNANDGLNNVIFVTDAWLFDPTNVAITRNFYIADGTEKAGLILDSDILINAVGFSFTTTNEPGKYDLQNTLTHEVGHFLGLGHEVGAIASDSTMFATTVSNEMTKRTLATNDIQGIFEAYSGPKNSQDFDGIRCEVADGSTGCLAVHGRSPRNDGWLSITWLALTLVIGRKFFSKAST